MSGTLQLTIASEPQGTNAARLARIDALAQFANVAWDLPERRFVDLLLKGITRLAQTESLEALDRLAEAALGTFERESGGPGSLLENSWDGESVPYVTAYVDEITTLATLVGEECRERNTRVPREQTLMEFAERIYREISVSRPRDIIVNILADLHHWSAARAARMPASAWF